jgi:hypothetical protein
MQDFDQVCVLGRPGRDMRFNRGQTLMSLVALLLLFTFLVNGQDRFTVCSPANKFIEIRVTAKTVSASENSPTRNIWVLAGTPGPEQVVVPGDDLLKGRIMEIMQQIQDSGLEIGVGKGGNPEPGDPNQLELLLADLDSVRPGFELILPVELTNPPLNSDLGKLFTVRLCLKYDSCKVPDSLQINIKTLASASGTASEISKTVDLSVAIPGLANTPAGHIPVTIGFTDIDLRDAKRDLTINSDAAAVERTSSELLSVAAKAFNEAIDKGLLTSSGVPRVDPCSGKAVAENVENALTNVYNLNLFDPQVDWARVKVRVGVVDSTPGSPWNISVSNLQLSQKIDIEVVKNPREMEYDNTSIEPKFAVKRQRLREKLVQNHSNSLSARPGRILTTEQIKADQEKLSTDKDVSSVERIRSDGQAQHLIYTVTRKMQADKDLATRLGVGYSPEDDFSGSLSFEENNFLGIAESAKLAYEGGPQIQKVRFNFARPFFSEDTKGWHATLFDITVQYFSDKDTRFGNLTPDEVAAREAGSTIRFSVAYDSFSLLDHSRENCFSEEDRKRTRLYLVANPVFSYRDVNIREDQFLSTLVSFDTSLLPRSRTQVTSLSLDVNAGVSHDFRHGQRAGLGIFNLSMQSAMARSFEAFGADYKFNKLRALISADMTFGVSSAKDFFVRYNRVMSTSTHGTPLFELARLGGPLTVRGLEEGEIIGRKLSADQFEFGVNALVLWHFVSRKPVASMLLRDCLDDSTPSLPIDLSNAYLKVFYDLGRVHDPDSFLDPVSKSTRGYGLAFELRQLGGKNINLSIGYAYSPDSALHKSGTIYTGVSYTF